MRMGTVLDASSKNLFVGTLGCCSRMGLVNGCFSTACPE